MSAQKSRCRFLSAAGIGNIAAAAMTRRDLRASTAATEHE